MYVAPPGEAAGIHIMSLPLLSVILERKSVGNAIHATLDARPLFAGGVSARLHLNIARSDIADGVPYSFVNALLQTPDW